MSTAPELKNEQDVLPRKLSALRNSRIGFNVFSFWILFVIVAAVDYYLAHPHVTGLNIYMSIMWSAALPICIIGLIGAYSSRKLKQSRFVGEARNKVIFLVPTVARHDTLPAVQRVINSILEHASRNLSDWRIDVVTEESATALRELRMEYAGNPHVRVLVVPATYETKQGTLYKARANQYALEQRTRDKEDTSDVFVYHLDDDTAIGSDTIAAIAEFIVTQSHKYYLAQGVLTFPHELSSSFLSKMADSVRPADDITRFHFFTGLLGRPLTGLHGEHLIVRADIERLIGWDFGPTVTVEDAYFGLEFANKYPGKSTFLNGCTYGASPASVGSLLKQRRRWASGIMSLVADRKIPLRSRVPLIYMGTYWALGFTQQVFLVLAAAFLLGIDNTSPVWQPIAIIWAFNLSFQIWMYWQGLKVNWRVSRKRKPYFLLAVLLVPVFFIVTILELIGTTLGLWSAITRQKGFEVISKPI